MIHSDEMIVAALLENSTITAAAAALGVSRSAVRNRMAKDGFQKLWIEQRTQALEAATSALQGSTGEAVAAAREILAGDLSSAQVKLNAAQLVLSNALRYTEQTDVLRRLDALERAATAAESDK